MARPLVSDELWGLIEPLIPKVASGTAFRAGNGSMTGWC